MNRDEWESLCDGCGKCCLTQLEDEASGVLVFTDVACDLLDSNTCRCTDYENRSERVPTCMTMDMSNIEACAEFAPPSCAYRLLFESKPLPDWHHLISGDRNAVHQAGKSVKNRVRKLNSVSPSELENYVVEWPTQAD